LDKSCGDPPVGAAVASGTEALVVLPDPMFWYERARIVALMPAIYPEREYIDDGGLLAYSQNVFRPVPARSRVRSRPAAYLSRIRRV